MKLSNLFRRKPSREVAKDRLKILLISDRVNCSPEILEMIKKDIAEVISRYMKIDTNNMEIQISKASTRGKGAKTPSIYANIPFLVIVMKDGRSEYSKRIHWLADARAEFTRQIRYHLGSKMNEMTRDKRFTFEREWTGKPYPVWVGRLAGEFYSYGITKAEAMMMAWEKVNSSSNTERK